jgi:hypothetical protein
MSDHRPDELSDLEHLQQRLREAAGPDERFAITITERFVHDGYGGHNGKKPEVYITRWTFQPIHEDAKGIADGDTVDLVMQRFEAWLAKRRLTEAA